MPDAQIATGTPDSPAASDIVATQTSRLPTYTLVAAVFLGLAWLFASWLMYRRFVQSDQTGTWDHALVLYNGLSSVGFTAIGVLLGTQVQQVNVSAARREAETARKSATEAKTDAAKLRAGARAAAKAATPAADLGGGSPADAAKAAAARLDAVRGHLIDLL